MVSYLIREEKRTRLLFYSIFSLAVGVLIYVCFRSNSIKILGFVDNKFSFLHQMRLEMNSVSRFVPNFVIYNLPDGLFLFSYTTCMLWLWDENQYKYYWVFIIPLLLVIIELLQINHTLPGTFDILDIVFYIIFIIFTFQIINYEKNN
jgi:hypothetical protein